MCGAKSESRNLCMTRDYWDRTAIIWSSTQPPWFGAATPTVARAGGSLGKNSRYTLLYASKS